LIPDSDLTRDDFLGGKLRLWQPARGYRAGIDAVFLAASLQGSDRVLELGAGTGAVMCCLLRRLPNAQVTGVERNPDYADLARRNAAGRRRIINTPVHAQRRKSRRRRYRHHFLNGCVDRIQNGERRRHPISGVA
jgi:tRNA1(Val) A37 N6-methylase TrmN6